MLKSISTHQMKEDMIGTLCFIIRRNDHGASQMICAEVIGITSNCSLVFSDPEQPKRMIVVSVWQIEHGDVILYSAKDVIENYSESFCVIKKETLTTD